MAIRNHPPARYPFDQPPSPREQTTEAVPKIIVFGRQESDPSASLAVNERYFDDALVTDPVVPFAVAAPDLNNTFPAS
jgi:hypothetical protein